MSEFNYNHKITYYLGAGASANAIPVVGSINEQLQNLCDFVNGFFERNYLVGTGNLKFGNRFLEKLELEQFIIFLKNWKSQVANTPSIDTYAKRLFDNGKKEQYREYKIFLTIAFHYFHFIKRFDTQSFGINSLDGRYENFFRSINSKSDRADYNTIIPACFKFITWNYDFQFEYSRVLDFSNEESSQSLKMKSFYESFGRRFMKLNGSAFLNNFDNEIYNACLKPNDPETVLSLLFSIYEELIINKTAIPTFRFSWEEEVDLEELAEIAKKTDVLVIIGYSFPSFNRKIDEVFYSNLKGEAIIYTQGRDMQDSIRIKNYFEQCFRPLPPEYKRTIIPVESPFFFVPPHYFEPYNYYNSETFVGIHF